MRAKDVPTSMNLDVRRSVLRIVQEQFRLEWRGIHGVPHWARVRCNGLTIARANGARPDIVELFAFLHDSRRFHDGRDREHGARGRVNVTCPGDETECLVASRERRHTDAPAGRSAAGTA